jgi:hypothetical protein
MASVGVALESYKPGATVDGDVEADVERTVDGGIFKSQEELDLQKEEEEVEEEEQVNNDLIDIVTLSMDHMRTNN